MRQIGAAGDAKFRLALIFHVTIGAVTGVDFFRVVRHFLAGAANRLIGLPVPVVFDGGVQGVGAQVGAVQFIFGETLQGLGHVIVGNLHGLVQGLAFGQLREHAGDGNGRPATEGLEFDIFDDVVFHFEIDVDHIAAYRVADLAHAVGISYIPDIARIFEVI